MASKAQEEPPEEPITFACQECGKSITFPADRGGHVEVCPGCGRYVDVPRKTEAPLLAESETAATPFASGKAEQQRILDPDGRTTAQLWFEVSAVLCLAYVPWLFGALTMVSFGRPAAYPFVNGMLYARTLQYRAPFVAHTLNRISRMSSSLTT